VNSRQPQQLFSLSRIICEHFSLGCEIGKGLEQVRIKANLQCIPARVCGNRRAIESSSTGYPS
jgi:hypothetical protein